MKVKLKNKNQLKTLLNLIKLTGYGEKGKSYSVFDEIVIKILEDGDVITYGLKSNVGIFFSYKTKFTDIEADGTIALNIPFIDSWIDFIDEIPGDGIIIEKKQSMVNISSSDKNSLFEFIDTTTDAIITYLDEPVIQVTDYGFRSTVSGKEYDEYSTINFDPKEVLKALNPGKKIGEIFAEFKFNKSKLSISVGSLVNEGGTKHVIKKVPGIGKIDWVHDGTQNWVNSSGIHSIINTLASADICNPIMNFIGEDKVLIIESEKTMYGNLEVDMIFSITPSFKDDDGPDEDED